MVVHSCLHSAYPRSEKKRGEKREEDNAIGEGLSI